VAELRSALASASGAQEDALAELTSGVGPELASRMRALKAAASQDAERRRQQRARRGSSLDGPKSLEAVDGNVERSCSAQGWARLRAVYNLTSKFIAFFFLPLVGAPDMEVEIFSAAAYSSKLVQLVCSAIALVVQELANKRVAPAVENTANSDQMVRACPPP
jgi:hypothetical protein